MHMRPMTPAEEDSAGLSRVQDCRICRTRDWHTCGGCGSPIKHHEGSTCHDCWRVIFDAQGDPDPEGTP